MRFFWLFVLAVFMVVCFAGGWLVGANVDNHVALRESPVAVRAVAAWVTVGGVTTLLSAMASGGSGWVRALSDVNNYVRAGMAVSLVGFLVTRQLTQGVWTGVGVGLLALVVLPVWAWLLHRRRA